MNRPRTELAPHPEWPSLNFEQIESISRSGEGLIDLWENSPVLLETNKPHTSEVIDTLYSPDTLLCCGWSRHRFDTRRRDAWYKLHDLQFIVPNPMTAKCGVTRAGKISTRSLSNTGSRRFLVVEFDFDAGRSTEEAGLLALLETEGRDGRDLCACLLGHLAAAAPLALVVDSGGKSLHGWFYCAGRSDRSLTQFMNLAVSLGADNMMWSRSQFARMPDGLRDNGRRQAVFYFNPAVVK
jgi:hypothetical protein